MAILELSTRRREQSRNIDRSPSRQGREGGELTTFVLLVLCFALTVGMVVERGHRAVKVGGPAPVTGAHPSTVPIPRSDARIAPSVDYAAWIADAGDNLGNSAADLIEATAQIVWEPAVLVSNRALGYVADSWVNPVTGDRVIFNAAPGALNVAAQILALTLVAVVMVTLAGPIYFTWKSRRLSRAGFRSN